jgi:prepilin-type N-terminal cleavage/methylation domain-containing protein
MNACSARRSAFSLVELVIVVVIIGIIGAIAIPRLSRGSAGAADSALRGDLAHLRSAIELYGAEHTGIYPTAATFVAQITTYSDDAGNTNATKTAVFQYGPYLKAVPPLPVGAAKGNTGVAASAGAGVGWIYTDVTGNIVSNTTATEVDARLIAWNTY